MVNQPTNLKSTSQLSCEEMVQALQNLIGDYRQQTMTARQNWQQKPIHAVKMAVDQTHQTQQTQHINVLKE